MYSFNDLRRPVVPVAEFEILNKLGGQVESVDVLTGELVSFVDNRVVPVDSAGLVDRYSLQSTIRTILKTYRVARCLRSPISVSHHISIFKNAQFNSVFFGGLQTCGSVWHCPVCAAKISERRVIEVQQAIDYCQALGGSVSFVTRTVPHDKQDSLKTILYQFRDAERFLKKHRQYKNLLKTFESFGQIKVFEITVGLNGWHLHVHEIHLHQNKQSLENLAIFEENFYNLWASVAVLAGFEEPSRAFGLQVQNGDFAAAYLAKFGKESKSNWNVSREITKQHIKKSKSGFSPFDLIRAYRDKQTDFLAGLILEYGETMHGQQQLIWSNGLKKLVAVEIVSDAEISAAQDAAAVLLGLLSLKQWRFIIKMDKRIEVLLMAKYHGFDGLTAFLTSIGAPSFEN